MLVRQIGDFGRFLEVISFSQASQLNLASLAREAEIPRKRANGNLLSTTNSFILMLACIAACGPEAPSILRKKTKV